MRAINFKALPLEYQINERDIYPLALCEMCAHLLLLKKTVFAEIVMCE